MTTIIHINPDTATQEWVREVLGKTYTLVSVSDAPTAIQYCAMVHPHLILIDSALPDFFDLTTRLKMFMPQTPILFLTESSVALSSTITDRDAVLPKPVAAEQLQQQVYTLLRAHESPVDVVPSVELEEQIAALSQANQRLASLNAISALIGTSLDLEHLTDEILQQIQKTVDFDSATLFLLKGNILEAAASRGLHTYGQGLNIFSRSDKNSAWKVVQNKLPLVINDVTISEHWEPRPELSQVRAWLGVPLIYKERVVGVLTLDKNEHNAFTDADARYIFTLAFQIAIAVENAQLFEEWESQATRLKLINEVNQKLTSILDVGSLYHTLARALVERLHYDRVIIFEMNPARTALVMQACYTHTQPSSAEAALPEGEFWLSADAGPLGDVVHTGRSMLVKAATVFESVPGMAVQSALITPLFVDNQVEVIINVDSQRANAFNDHDLWTMSSLATHAAAIIENARLYHHVDAYSERLQRTVAARTQRLQAIKNISQVISQGIGVADLLDVVGQRIQQIFGEAADQTIQVATALLSGSRLTVQVIFDAAPQDHRHKLVENTHRLVLASAVGQVVNQVKAMVLHNVDVQKIFTVPTAGQPEMENENTLMVVPLIAAGKTIGAILVYTLKAQAFDDDDLEILETVAFQVASAIEYAHLLGKTREMAIVDERTRLARDMHDGVAQNLAYLLIQVDRCLNMVDEGSKLEQQLESIGALLEQNIDELRRNIFDLRPVGLEGKSLFEVLENFVAEFGRRWTLNMRCTVDHTIEPVTPAVESTIYRILQEGLSNARQHANCTNVQVTLAAHGQHWLTLTIQDDGAGFSVDKLNNLPRNRGDGLGLSSMRERAESVGGAIEITSIPGHGTKIEAKLPIHQTDKISQLQPTTKRGRSQ